MDEKITQYIKSNWGIKGVVEMANDLELPFNEILELALKLNLNRKTSINVSRRWTSEEDAFLIKYADKIKIPDASNLLCRSKSGVYQRIRFLGLTQMIDKKK